tara:strand:+ start:452 stop:1123 length:672 start_codon:yes stop_codon:yes gene_type:complete
MRELFVVCTKEDKYIFKCVENINRNHPNADILIVDSDSDNKDYMRTIDNDKRYKNVIVSKFKNKNYEYGAILHGFLNYKNKYDVFFFVQDNLYYDGTIDSRPLKEDTAWVFNAYRDGWMLWQNHYENQKKQFPDFFNHPKYVCPNNLLNVQWNSFIIRTKTFDKCINSEIFSLIGAPINKFGSIHWERIWTSMFLANAIQIRRLTDFQYGRSITIRKVSGYRQ